MRMYRIDGTYGSKNDEGTDDYRMRMYRVDGTYGSSLGINKMGPAPAPGWLPWYYCTVGNLEFYLVCVYNIQVGLTLPRT